MAVANPCLQEDWDEQSNKTVANKRIPWRERMKRWIKAEVREGVQANEEEESEERVDNEVSDREDVHKVEEIEDEKKEEKEMIEDAEEEETEAFEKKDHGEDGWSSDGYERVDEGEERENKVETLESRECDDDEEEAEVEQEEREDKGERPAKLQEERDADKEENEALQEQDDQHLQVWYNNPTPCDDDENQESRPEEDEEPAEENNGSGSMESYGEVSDSTRSEDENVNWERLDIEEVPGELQEEEDRDERSLSDDVSLITDWTSQETDKDGREESSFDKDTVNESFTMEEEFQDEDLLEEDSTDDEEEQQSVDEDEDHIDEDDLKIYSIDDYATNIFLSLTEFKDSSLFTDLILTTLDGSHIEVHFLVMAAVSSLVWRNLSENKTNRKDRDSRAQRFLLSLGPEVDSAGLEAVVEFAYTGLVSNLNLDTVSQIKIAAQKLGAPRVLDLCAKFLKSAKRGNHVKKERMCARHQLLASLQVIKQLWQDGVGCDVVLDTGEGSLPVHRVILAVCSDYFRSMFTLAMKESRQQRVTLPLLSAVELEVLVSCSYSGVLQLSWKGIFEVTSTALQLQHQPALSLCFDFLRQEINPLTCLDVVSFAESYQLPQILEVGNDFILRQFQKVAFTSKFKDLSGRKLFKYLKSLSLCVSSELVVFKAIVSWIQAKPKSRVGLMKILMKTIHFALMTFKEFKEVRSNDLWSNTKLRPVYEDIVQDFCSNDTTQRNQCRVYLPKESLVLTGGEQITDDLGRRSVSKELWFGNSLRNLTGIRKAMEWRRLGEMPEPARFSHEVAVLKGQLYVFGGKKYYGNGDILSCVSRFDPLQNTWESLAEMLERRSSFSVVVMDGKILAIGGQSDPGFRDSVEQYCPVTDSWSFMWPLELPLCGHVAKCLHGKIFVCGGRNNDYPCVASMFQYHPETGSTFLSNMSKPRAHHCMEVLGQSLYVVGGISREGQVHIVDLFSCEVYSPAMDSWSTFTSLPVPHVGAASAVLEGKLYVLGGYSQEDYSDTKMVHRYDPATQQWENMGKMPGPNNDMCASVMCLPHHFRS